MCVRHETQQGCLYKQESSGRLFLPAGIRSVIVSSQSLLILSLSAARQPASACACCTVLIPRHHARTSSEYVRLQHAHAVCADIRHRNARGVRQHCTRIERAVSTRPNDDVFTRAAARGRSASCTHHSVRAAVVIRHQAQHRTSSPVLLYIQFTLCLQRRPAVVPQSGPHRTAGQRRSPNALDPATPQLGRSPPRVSSAHRAAQPTAPHHPTKHNPNTPGNTRPQSSSLYPGPITSILSPVSSFISLPLPHSAAPCP